MLNTLLITQLILPNNEKRRSKVNSSYWYPLQDACAAFLPNLEIAFLANTNRYFPGIISLRNSLLGNLS